MNIIICGAGRVGFTIAKLLTEQNHSITVIDQSGDDIQKINDSLDVKAIVGKATSPSVLERANTSDADMIIAVTRNDEINMLICQIAYSIFKVPKKIARIRSQEYLDPKFSTLFNRENLPIDYVISPELEIAKSIQRKLEAPGALDNVPFVENKIRLLEILIDDNCPINGIKLNDLTKKFPKLNAYILGVIRKGEFKILKKNDSLEHNVRYGRPDATDDEVERACHAAKLEKTIDDLPDGLKTKVGERGVMLSGGEKQRVAIARAFLKSPRVLVADEATSALDTATESQILESLEEIARDRTSVFVAHRLSTVMKCTRIIVMRDGEIVEQGSHDELVVLSGLYAKMWVAQQAEELSVKLEKEVELGVV